ncbi:MAG: KpsF/GutQ family sugar-phosphate isomerase [Piscirickettsiaceae bacterium CG_4_9_14_3_um_filter_43_564]|nr:KpsF/GutQ family sugar-phosphate isomerase [Thiomicrospira sp.]OIP93539.1 MAG: arabinose-5-phosphate isomerase [Thiomicrospira sp. CG2_30_44_34]PIQ05209.1 MAG: arabinose-5-phosphate isomerase [Piscirickettsiaceae bacterium CG18_big_fil_WC_8_21_14_2_50_44_103]PIU38787.1 MAG: KpsF/GutQ family sugar-phosphate isomerase [Piscirickettsiaceae bacterium CG07_land_8_20_14_0_80_44_28]PIW57135.1 MAG: KpsF/GutQ family sugar-phosphate isomerase [Piscirickettsiaceae bacterium CG12_big_fil_rev_8_21_14_0_6
MNSIDTAKRVIQIEAEAILALSQQLDNHFSQSVDAILATEGRVVICGMGKSGLIGKKIMATFASTGTPCFFMHPGEAFHGDLGMVSPKDVFIALSNSGETEEVIKLIPFLKDNGNVIIAMTGRPNSTLAQNADFHLNIAVPQEACPHQLAPTSSTTATLVMGDALAVALMEQRGFQPQDFARFHPGGSLGRKLLTRVKHEMKSENLPFVESNASMKDVIHTMTDGRLGLCIVDQGKGIITDGDLRRQMEEHPDSFMQQTAADMMSPNPKTIDADARLSDAEEQMNQQKITSLLVSQSDPEHKIVGVIQIYDLNR